MNDRQDEPKRTVHPNSDELLRILIESATDFAIFAIDPEGRVISWNIGAQRMTGYREDEILGGDGDILFTPEDRAKGAPLRERRVAREQGRAINERWHNRKDGSRFWGSGLLMPLRDGLGFVKIMRDLTARHQAHEELRESEARFRMLATNIPQLVFRSRATGERTWGSPQWEIYAGLPDADSREFGWLEAVHPEDRRGTVDAWRSAQATLAYDVEHRIRRAADGEYRWHQTRARPIQDESPDSSEWVGTSTDIHELRGLQDRQEILLVELQHRTRNLLAIVQAMARQTLRTSSSPELFTTQFEGRLRALSRVQGLLARTNHEKAELREIVDSELAAFEEAGDKVTIEGPAVELSPVPAQAFTLAVHELATNAVKYGAIGKRAGRLTVSWRVEEEEPGRRVVVFDWRETGVPIPEPVRRKGYGTQLIERALPYQLQARTRLEFLADGVHCSIRVDMPPAETEHG